jgi:hypothetical protein
MEQKSKDMPAAEAISGIGQMNNPDFIVLFTEGDDRKTVLDAAKKRHDALKQGQVGNITEETRDFKQGVQGTKLVTCEDIVQSLRDKGREI